MILSGIVGPVVETCIVFGRPTRGDDLYCTITGTDGPLTKLVSSGASFAFWASKRAGVRTARPNKKKLRFIDNTSNHNGFLMRFSCTQRAVCAACVTPLPPAHVIPPLGSPGPVWRLR